MGSGRDREGDSPFAPPAGPRKKHDCPDCKMCQWCSDVRCNLCRDADRGESAFAGMSFAEQIEMYERICKEEREGKEDGEEF